MRKKIISLFAGAALLVPTIGFSVGLGSVRTYSHLNEKLRAEIPVLSVKQQGRMTVSLAPNAEFAKRGVQRSDILNSLNFALVERKGRFYINVSSREQIAVPYLNFILRLNTPEGVVSREYAIFLDPIGNAPKQSVTKKSVTNSPYRSSKNTAPKKRVTKRTPRKTVAPRSNLNVSSAKGGRYGPVRRGETLWSIAAHTRPSPAISVRDMMTAIKRANSRKLSRGLQAGTTITIPTIEGYAAYNGGYAPMPEAVAAAKPKAKPKQTAKTTKKTQPKAVTPKPKQVADAVAEPKTTNAETGTVTEVARPEIPEETLVQTLPAKTASVEKLVQTLPSETQSIEKPLTTETGISEKTVAQQLVDESKSTLDKTSAAIQETGATVAEAGKVGITTADDKLKEAANSLKESTEAVVDKASLITDDVSEKTAELTQNTEKAVSEASQKTTEQVAAKTTGETTQSAVTTSTPANTQPVKPAVKTATPATEPSLLDTAMDSAPYIGGGAVLAGLGWLLFNRRRKANQVAALTDADRAELMGENDVEALQSVEEELDTLAEKVDESLPIETLALNSDDTDALDLSAEADKDFDIIGPTKVEGDELVIDDELSIEHETAAGEMIDLSDDTELFDLDDEVIELSDTVDVDLESDLEFSVNDELSSNVGEIANDVDAVEEELTHALDETVEDLAPLDFSVDEQVVLEDKVDALPVSDEDIELTFNLDDEAEKDLFKPIDLEGTTDAEIELAEEFDFDLTDGDDLDELLNIDGESLASSDGVDDLAFSLTETKDDMVDGIVDLKDALVEKVEDVSLSFSDTVDDAKEVIADKVGDVGLSLSDVGEPVTDTLTEAQHDLELSLSRLETGLEEATSAEIKFVSPEIVSRMRMKMDLANSFISIGEDGRAKELLKEIIDSGNAEQIIKAKELLDNLG